MGFSDEFFNRQPAPRQGKPPHVWQGVQKIEDHVLKAAAPDQKKNPWRFRCPAPMCFYNVSAHSEKDAERARDTHPCPWFAGGTTTISWGIMSDSFILPIWKMLDECMDQIMTPPGDLSADEFVAKERAKYEARGLAKTLAVLMPPFFHHPDEIAKEAKVRYEHRQSGEDYETPGIGRLRFKPPSYNLGMLAAEAPRVTAAAGAAAKLTDKERDAIKNALSVPGMFTEAELAKVYGITEAAVKAVMAGG